MFMLFKKQPEAVQCLHNHASTFTGESHLTLKYAIRGLLVVGALCGASANAVTITYDSTLDAQGIPTTTVAGATVVNFSAGCTGYASCFGNGAIVQGSLPGRYAAPGLLSDTNPYLSVPLDLSQTTLSATLLLPTTANYFGLFWGSIDDYNTLSFLLNGSTVASFTGLDITSPANGNQSAPATNTYVNFFDLPTFNGVVISSTQYAFESDNHAYASVPEPATLALLSAGLLGMGVGRRRRKVTSMPA